MKVTFQNPHDKDYTVSIAVPWAGALLFPVRTTRWVWTLRKLSRMTPARMERAVEQLADELEARGCDVERNVTKRDLTIQGAVMREAEGEQQ